MSPHEPFLMTPSPLKSPFSLLRVLQRFSNLLLAFTISYPISWISSIINFDWSYLLNPTLLQPFHSNICCTQLTPILKQPFHSFSDATISLLLWCITPILKQPFHSYSDATNSLILWCITPILKQPFHSYSDATNSLLQWCNHFTPALMQPFPALLALMQEISSRW
jgi:hypothetical protein